MKSRPFDTIWFVSMLFLGFMMVYLSALSFKGSDVLGTVVCGVGAGIFFLMAYQEVERDY